jgi:hypothetical protein
MEKLRFLQSFNDEMSAYARLQESKPQNLAHALADSPAGQLAWSGQLFGDALSPDEILTNVAIYWLTNTAASSARFYYENHHSERTTEPTTVPTGVTIATSSPGMSTTAAATGPLTTPPISSSATSASFSAASAR